MKANLCKPAAAPDPVRLNRINQRRNHTGVNAVAQKLCPLRHCPGNDRRRGRAEHQIKYEVRPVKTLVGRKDVEPGLADQPDHVLTQQKTKADQDKHHRADAEIHQVLHNDVSRILRPGKSCLDHRKSGLHPEHQRSADQKPDAENLSVHYLHNLFCHFFILLIEASSDV